MDSYRNLAIAYHIFVLSPAFCLAVLPFALLAGDVILSWRRKRVLTKHNK